MILSGVHKRMRFNGIFRMKLYIGANSIARYPSMRSIGYCRVGLVCSLEMSLGDFN